MEIRELKIDNIPAILYGSETDKCFLFLHGKMGFKEEAKEFAEIVYEKGWQVISIDLPEHGERKEETDRFNPWCVVPELQSVLRYMQSKWKKLALRANSIGAWFSMQSFEGSEFERSLFVSPIIDMEKLIKDMMMWSEVSEKRLKEESIIATEFGETLSWEYYEYARQHKINKWDCKTEVLYAGNDNMTSKETVEEFVHKFELKLTIMDNGEHWFHTPEQLEVLEAWTKRSCYDILL